MYEIAIILFVLAMLIIFRKWCGNREILFYRVLLAIGLLPFICNFIYSIMSTRNGFVLFDFPKTYGLKAFGTCFFVYIMFGLPIFLIAGIAIIISTIKLIKLNKKVK